MYIKILFRQIFRGGVELFLYFYFTEVANGNISPSSILHNTITIYFKIFGYEYIYSRSRTSGGTSRLC